MLKNMKSSYGEGGGHQKITQDYNGKATAKYYFGLHQLVQPYDNITGEESMKTLTFTPEKILQDQKVKENVDMSTNIGTNIV